MLNKQIKYVKELHDDLFVTERRISREIGKIQKKAKTDFKKLLKAHRKYASISFSSLHDDAFTKYWNGTMIVHPKGTSMNDDELEEFCRLASEKIGITFILNED